MLRKRILSRNLSPEENDSWRLHETKGKFIDKHTGMILVYCPTHPRARKGCLEEHRLVIENDIKRYLTSKETIHHKDRNKQNNKLENLQLFESRGRHAAHHRKEEGWVLKCDIRTKEHCKNISKSLIGKKRSDETKRKLSIIGKRLYKEGKICPPRQKKRS